MVRKISSSFSLAWNNIQANFFHTFLSVLGVVIGVGALVSILSLIDGMEKFARDQMIIIPIVKAVTKVPFQAAYTLNTFLIISIISIAVGIIFGTYPAIRASRLNPVDAIRHE